MTIANKLWLLPAASIIALALVACSGGGSLPSTSSSTPPPTAQVKGVATPSAIAVVTATHTQ